MSSSELETLAKIGKLKREPPSLMELQGLLRSAETRLTDAGRVELSYDSRFDLAYNAAHALALFALRRIGYRSDNRYLVFQLLTHTAGLPAATWRVLSKAHERRNAVEYGGLSEPDARLLSELLAAAHALHAVVRKLPLPDEGAT